MSARYIAATVLVDGDPVECVIDTERPFSSQIAECTDVDRALHLAAHLSVTDYDPPEEPF